MTDPEVERQERAWADHYSGEAARPTFEADFSRCREARCALLAQAGASRAEEECFAGTDGLTRADTGLYASVRVEIEWQRWKAGWLAALAWVESHAQSKWPALSVGYVRRTAGETMETLQELARVKVEVGKMTRVPVRISYPDDCKRIQEWLWEEHWYMDLSAVQDFWRWHSEELCASWLIADGKSEVLQAFEKWIDRRSD